MAIAVDVSSNATCVCGQPSVYESGECDSCAQGAMQQTRIIAPFKSSYYSISRIRLYEKCALSFKFKYIDGIGETFGEAAELGKAVHGAIEKVMKWCVAEEYVGAVPDALVSESYRKGFAEAQLAGVEKYNEGLSIVRRYFSEHSKLDHTKVLAVEHGFDVEIGGYRFVGFIDRMDKVDDTTVHIIDYKTNAMLFTREEVEQDLQLSLYGIVARKLFPWAKNVQFSFDMVRHGVRMNTERTVEQLIDAANYLAAIIERMEKATEYPAKLNELCGWCGYRNRCEQYIEATKVDLEANPEPVDLGDIEAVASERMRMSAIRSIADRRQKEMDKILAARLKLIEAKELVAGGKTFCFAQQSEVVHPVDKTVAFLAKELGRPEDEVRAAVACIDNARLKEWLDEVDLERIKKRLMLARLEAMADKRVKRPYLYVQRGKK